MSDTGALLTTVDPSTVPSDSTSLTTVTTQPIVPIPEPIDHSIISSTVTPLIPIPQTPTDHTQADSFVSTSGLVTVPNQLRNAAGELLYTISGEPAVPAPSSIFLTSPLGQPPLFTATQLQQYQQTILPIYQKAGIQNPFNANVQDLSKFPYTIVFAGNPNSVTDLLNPSMYTYGDARFAPGSSYLQQQYQHETVVANTRFGITTGAAFGLGGLSDILTTGFAVDTVPAPTGLTVTSGPPEETGGFSLEGTVNTLQTGAFGNLVNQVVGTLKVALGQLLTPLLGKDIVAGVGLPPSGGGPQPPTAFTVAGTPQPSGAGSGGGIGVGQNAVQAQPSILPFILIGGGVVVVLFLWLRR